MKRIRHIVCVSDIHAGSTVAVCPQEFELDDGGLYRYSKYQRVLWQWWTEFWGKWIRHCVGREPYAVVINGDALEGVHHGSTSAISMNLADQERLAFEILEPVRQKCARFFLIRGTEAHVGKTGQHEEQLAIKLDADGEGKTASRWDLWAELGGRLIHFAHHIGTTSSSSYESSALMRELTAAFVEAGQWGERFPDLVIRSHRHRYSKVGVPTYSGQAEVHVTPGWQLHTPFTYKAHSMRIPQIGGICITASNDGLLIRRRIWAPARASAVKMDDERREAKLVRL